MAHKPILFLLMLVFFSACDKDDDNSAVTIHCDGLITDTTGTGDNGRVFMPNAFTPNGDGLNDLSRPLLENIAGIEFTIYDKNSSIVFTSSTIGQGWNTISAGNSATKYYFRIQATTNSGHKIGTCGELNKLFCFPGGVSRSNFYFEDQSSPFGVIGVTSEPIDNCP